MNSSVNFLNVYNIILRNEGNYVGVLILYPLKEPVKITISMYFIICQSDTYLIIDLKVNRFRGNNREHNMKNHMFTPN